MRIVMLFVFLCTLAFARPVSAELYRWTDAKGQESYTNDPNKIPQEFRSKAVRVEESPDRVSVGGKPPASHRASRASADEHKDKYGHGEEWWRNRAEKLRGELRDLEDEYDLVLKKERDEEQHGKTLGGRKKKSKTNYGSRKLRIEKKIAQAKRRLEVDLPEEARKADAYPGWLRE